MWGRLNSCESQPTQNAGEYQSRGFSANTSRVKHDSSGHHHVRPEHTGEGIDILVHAGQWARWTKREQSLHTRRTRVRRTSITITERRSEIRSRACTWIASPPRRHSSHPSAGIPESVAEPSGGRGQVPGHFAHGPAQTEKTGRFRTDGGFKAPPVCLEKKDFRSKKTAGEGEGRRVISPSCGYPRNRTIHVGVFFTGSHYIDQFRIHK